MRMAVKAMIAVAALGLSGAALAQTDWKAERAAGRIGEQADGYLGVVKPGGPQLDKLVADVNARRKEHYFARAGDQTPALFAQIAGCSLITDLSASEMYKTPGGAWRQRGTGTPELAAICPRS